MSGRLTVLFVVLCSCCSPVTARADALRFPWQESAQEQRRRLEYQAYIQREFVAANRVVPLVVEVNDSVKDAQLIVPRKLLAGLRQIVGKQAQTSVTADEIPTVAAGVSLSLAFVFAGLRLTRRRSGSGVDSHVSRGSQKGLPQHWRKILVLVVLISAGGTVLWANAQAPPSAPLAGGGDGPTVCVQIVEQGDAIKLQVNRAALIWFVHGGQSPAAGEKKK